MKKQPDILEWDTSYDESNNTLYEAVSNAYQSDSDGGLLYYRITPLVSDDKMKFSIMRTDEELLVIGPSCGDETGVFDTLIAAKACCEQEERESLQYAATDD